MAGLTELDLKRGLKRNRISTIMGERERHIISINGGQSMHPGRDVIIKIPRVDMNKAIVPGTLNLVYTLNVTGGKSTFKNNLGKQIVSRMVIQVGKKVIYDNTHENVLRVYEDLWKGKTWRNNAIEFGVANENTRKLISADDTASSSGDDKVLFEIYGKRQKISLNMILEEQGLFPSGSMHDDINITLYLAKESDVLVAQTGQDLGTYTISDLALEYDTIKDEEAVGAAASNYLSGRDWMYCHATHDDLVDVAVGSTYLSTEIKSPRSIARYVLGFFKAAVTSGDSEEYLYPGIKQVTLTHMGESVVIYNGDGGLGTTYLFEEAKRIMHGGENRSDQNLSIADFYTNKFVCPIDCRTVAELGLLGNGKRVSGSNSGLRLKITFDPPTTVAYRAHFYLISDGVVNFANSKIIGVEE